MSVSSIEINIDDITGIIKMLYGTPNVVLKQVNTDANVLDIRSDNVLVLH